MTEPFLCFPKLSRVFWADIQILFSAFFFGIGFIGQRAVSVDGLGPMACNSLRFGLSSILLYILLPFLPDTLFVVLNEEDSNDLERTNSNSSSASDERRFQLITKEDLEEIDDKSARVTDIVIGGFSVFRESTWQSLKSSVLFWGILLGIINFMGSGLQQWGITMTSANKVAFIAGFDLFLTPIFSLFVPTFKRNGRPTPSTWIAVAISIVGLYLLSDSDISELQMGKGELLTLISTVFWTLHITYTDIATSYVDTLRMMNVQLTVVSILSFILALFTESFSNFTNNLFLYLPWMVFLAVVEGLGFTLMALGQTMSPPTHAAIILSLEGVFASVASYLLLGETLTVYEFNGCCLMLFATAFAKLGSRLVDSLWISFNCTSLFMDKELQDVHMHGINKNCSNICCSTNFSRWLLKFIKFVFASFINCIDERSEHKQ